MLKLFSNNELLIFVIAYIDGETLVKYEYDPWGKCTIVSDTSENNLGTLNPFRYRGYYVDTVGKNKKKIEEYIRNQLQEDIACD